MMRVRVLHMLIALSVNLLCIQISGQCHEVGPVGASCEHSFFVLGARMGGQHGWRRSRDSENMGVGRY